MSTSPHMIVAEIASAGAAFGTVLGYLPPLVALMAVAWYVVCFYESPTVKALYAKAIALIPKTPAKPTTASVLADLKAVLAAGETDEAKVLADVEAKMKLLETAPHPTMAKIAWYFAGVVVLLAILAAGAALL